MAGGVAVLLGNAIAECSGGTVLYGKAIADC